MKNIIWIASYPKSGNTWARYFLGCLLTGGPVKLTELSNSYQCTSRVLFEEFGDKIVLDNPIEALKQRVRVQGKFNESLTQPQLVKTHTLYGAYAPNNSKRPILLFDRNSSAAAIVIVRNPFDTCVSLANHGKMSPSDAIGNFLKPNAILNPSESMLPTLVGSWANNVSSWIRQNHMTTRVFRYEDFFLEPLRTFTVLAKFAVNIDDPDRIQEAIEASDFSKLQRREEEEGLHDESRKTPRFFWKGGIGHAFDVLSSSDRERIWQACGATARTLGYDYDGKQLIVENVPALPDTDRRTYQYPESS